jgi:hypothetical protein
MPKTPATKRTKRTKRNALAASVLVVAIGSAAIPSHSQSAGPDASSSQATTQKDRTDLSLTVYNAGIALVRDVRQIQLQPGVAPLRFEDVSASINPVTVHFRSLTDAQKINVIEQNYEYDLLDPQKLLQKYVGREVTLVRGEEDASSTRWVETKALLLSDNGNAPVWKIGNEIVTGIPTDHYKFPDLPNNLYTQPTLIWTLDNRGAASQKVEASYLTGGLNWSADYVLTVARDEKSADLNGWVTLVNNSGVGYENAKLQLVAGKIHQVEDARAMRKVMASASMALEAAPAPPQFQQENFSEYHLYTLGRETSVQNNESKQISLLAGTDIAVEKYLLVESDRYYFRNPQGIGNAIPQPVKVYYRFKNDKAHSLGMPLPAGTVRVYQADSKGGTQFVGEDNIDHTPKDENVRIYTGQAFDVVCERKQLDYKKVASNQYEMQLQISLRNHKDAPVTVEVREPIGGDWEILDSNFKWTKLDSSTVGFSIPVEKDGSSTLTYKVRVKW